MHREKEMSWKWRLKFVFAFIGLFAVTDATTTLKTKCTNVDEFYYATPGSRCTTYYKCTHKGRTELKECGAGSMFDFYSQTCTRSAGTCYEPICTGRTNGVYQDTTHACRRAYTCHGGRLTSIDNCPPQHLHNGQKCVSQDLVMCELPQTTAIGYRFEGDRRCQRRADGFYGVEDCRSYIECYQQDVANILECPDGYRFKDDSQQCVPAHLVSFCPSRFTAGEDVCLSKRDGRNVDPSSLDCSTYIICKQGQFESREQCSQQAVFNGEQCVPGPLYTCPSTIWESRNDICKRKANGFYINPQEGCTAYVRCLDERTVELYNCPDGQYFDPDERICIYEKFVERRKCVEPQRTPECNGKAQGFYQGPNCSTYYYCLNGAKTEYQCPANKLFNGDKCVSRSHYTCPSASGHSCNGKTDGYHRDKNNGCRAYYFCSNGHKITYLCEEGNSFDGNRCSPDALCRTEDAQCYGKSDGYHADVKSNCRNYVYCQNFEKITQLTCRGDNVFNGQKCVRTDEHACTSLYNHRQLNCTPRRCVKPCAQDGFYPDIDAGCRKYFFCIGGKASTLACAAGKVFNGELCVAEDTYTCPYYCDEYTSLTTSCPLGGWFL